MVIIELYKPRVTHIIFNEGNEEFSISKLTNFFFIFPIFQTYFPIKNNKICNFILGGVILNACRNF